MSVTVRKGYFKLAFAAAAMGFMIFAHSGKLLMLFPTRITRQNLLMKMVKSSYIRTMVITLMIF